MQIEITTDRNPEGWGSECDEVIAQRAAERLAEMLADEAQREWPDAEVQFGTIYVTSGYSHQIARVSADSVAEQMATQEVAAQIAAWSEELWEAALAVAIRT